MKFTKKIKQLRKEREWSQETMATKLNISLNSYGAIERGDTNLGLIRIEEIAEVFDITLESLFENVSYKDNDDDDDDDDDNEEEDDDEESAAMMASAASCSTALAALSSLLKTTRAKARMSRFFCSGPVGPARNSCWNASMAP